MGGKVAVLEDDDAIATLLKRLLAMEGYDVTVVRDGRQAMHVLESGSFDAALLDVTLPGKDGISIMREIRDNPPTRDLPVVMLTAKTDVGSTWEGWKAGCDLYVTKPFDPEQLIRWLRGVIHNR
ncbi:MAG: response regulator [Actinomycetota bacterium]